MKMDNNDQTQHFECRSSRSYENIMYRSLVKKFRKLPQKTTKIPRTVKKVVSYRQKTTSFL